MTTSVCLLLFGVIGVWYFAGDLSFRRRSVTKADLDSTTIMLLLVLFVFGTAKAACFPTNGSNVLWYPYQIPLRCCCGCKGGCRKIIKVVVYIFGLDH